MKCASLGCRNGGPFSEYLMTVEMDSAKGENLYGSGVTAVTVLLCEPHFRNVGSIVKISLPEPGEL